LIQHEYYGELLDGGDDQREVELDATGAEGQAEKVFTDEDMWQVHAT
jgi:hypothetical protein